MPADRQLRDGHWTKSELVGYNLRGKRLGIVGLGSIGTRVAELGLAWGMRPIGCVDHPTDERRAAFADAGHRPRRLRPVVAEADFVTSTCRSIGDPQPDRRAASSPG